MSQSERKDPVAFDREQTRRTALVALVWFLLVAAAAAILLTFGDGFQRLRPDRVRTIRRRPGDCDESGWDNRQSSGDVVPGRGRRAKETDGSN